MSLHCFFVTSLLAPAVLGSFLEARLERAGCNAPDLDPEGIKFLESLQGAVPKNLTRRDAKDAVKVKTYVHIVSDDDTARGGNLTSESIDKQMSVLNADYKDTGFQFELKDIDWTAKPEWSKYQDEKAMKTALRKGSYQDLNLYYVNGFSKQATKGFGPSSSLSGLLDKRQSGATFQNGECRYPKSVKSNVTDAEAAAQDDDVALDGCVILASTVPGPDGSGGGGRRGQGGSAVGDDDDDDDNTDATRQSASTAETLTSRFKKLFHSRATGDPSIDSSSHPGDPKVTSHEVGHWFSLLHTFEGNDCKGKNDYIDDTSPEASANFDCNANRNSCPNVKSQPDPVDNFMDYTPSKCNGTQSSSSGKELDFRFTPGQIHAMQSAWDKYRRGGGQKNETTSHPDDGRPTDDGNPIQPGGPTRGGGSPKQPGGPTRGGGSPKQPSDPIRGGGSPKQPGGPTRGGGSPEHPTPPTRGGGGSPKQPGDLVGGETPKQPSGLTGGRNPKQPGRPAAGGNPKQPGNPLGGSDLKQPDSPPTRGESNPTHGSDHKGPSGPTRVGGSNDSTSPIRGGNSHKPSGPIDLHHGGSSLQDPSSPTRGDKPRGQARPGRNNRAHGPPTESPHDEFEPSSDDDDDDDEPQHDSQDPTLFQPLPDLDTELPFEPLPEHPPNSSRPGRLGAQPPTPDLDSPISAPDDLAGAQPPTLDPDTPTIALPVPAEDFELPSSIPGSPDDDFPESDAASQSN